MKNIWKRGKGFGSLGFQKVWRWAVVETDDWKTHKILCGECVNVFLWRETIIKWMKVSSDYSTTKSDITINYHVEWFTQLTNVSQYMHHDGTPNNVMLYWPGTITDYHTWQASLSSRESSSWEGFLLISPYYLPFLWIEFLMPYPYNNLRSISDQQAVRRWSFQGFMCDNR